MPGRERRLDGAARVSRADGPQRDADQARLLAGAKEEFLLDRRSALVIEADDVLAGVDFDRLAVELRGERRAVEGHGDVGEVVALFVLGVEDDGRRAVVELPEPLRARLLDDARARVLGAREKRGARLAILPVVALRLPLLDGRDARLLGVGRGVVGEGGTGRTRTYDEQREPSRPCPPAHLRRRSIGTARYRSQGNRNSPIATCNWA